MWRNVQTYTVVTVVTLLIWMLAESEGVRTENIRVNLILTADGDGRRLLEIPPGQGFTGTVLMTLNGAVANIDLLTRELANSITLAPPMPGLPSEPGEHRIDLRTVLAAYPPIRDGGVTVSDVDPPILTVLIDDMTTREAKVVIRTPPGSITGTATPNPATALVRVPARLAVHLPQTLEVSATINPNILAALPAGKFATIPEVVLAIPEALAGRLGSEHVRLDPPTVSVSLTPAGDEITRTLTSIPVQLLLPPIELDRWEIDMPQSDWAIPEAQITGPAELVQQAVDKKLLVVAMVQPTFGELENAARTGEPLVKEVFFSSLPSAVRIETTERSVTLTVRARPAAPAGPTESPAP